MRGRLLLVVLAVALAAHPVFAQNTARQARSPQMRKAERVEASEVVEKQHAAVDTLRNYDPLADASIWYADSTPPNDSGFVHGTNYFEDQAKATLLTLPDDITEALVKEVNVFFAFKRDGLTTQTYSIDILDGNVNDGPGALLGSQTFMMADINADEDIATFDSTVHVFTAPVQVGSTFFVSVNFGVYGPVDWANVAIVSSELVGMRLPEDWDQWGDGVWHNSSDTWWSQSAAPGTGTDGWRLWIEAVIDTDLTTATEDADELPRAFTLVQNYPNPFNTATTLQMELPARAEVTLHVIDLLGRTVATLADGPMEAGIHTVRFDAEGLPPGIYLARLRTDAVTMTRKMVLVR